MSVDCFRNGQAVSGDWPGLRALHYGDGHFTTMRVVGGRVVWWPLHRRRLEDANRRLRGTFSDWDLLEAQIAKVAAGLGTGVLKLLATRSRAQRGYASAGSRAEWLWFSEPGLPGQRPGLVLRTASLRLAIQPALAGMKHLNRLEQVLARDEFAQAACDDVLLLDAEGSVACTTSANVFAWIGDTWVTPPVDRCGVAGVCRQRLLEMVPVAVRPLAPAELLAAGEVFCCNAVRGVMPVVRLDDSAWLPGPRTQAVMMALEAELGC